MCTNKDLEEKLRVAEKEVQRVNAINQELIRSLHELKQGPSPYITTKTVKRTPALKDGRNRCWWSIVYCFRYGIAGCDGDKIYKSISEKPFGNFIKETIDNNDEFSNAIERVESRRKMNVFERPPYQSYSAFGKFLNDKYDVKMKEYKDIVGKWIKEMREREEETASDKQEILKLDIILERLITNDAFKLLIADLLITMTAFLNKQ